MKKQRRIRVFLGGYVNSMNAQNLNCRALSEHINQDKFEVWTMLVWHPRVTDFKKTQGVHYLYDTPSPWTEKFHLPYWLFAWMTYAIGIIQCDVAFLPKGEYVYFCRALGKLFHCKIFTTVEGLMTGTNLEKQKKTRYGLNSYLAFQPNVYGITRTISKQLFADLNIPTQDKVLYLGVESEQFANTRAQDSRLLQNVVFIGNNIQYKGIEDVLRMAKQFPAIHFHCVGGKQMKNGLLDEYIIQNGLSNVEYHGLLDHTRLSELLRHMDLMFFPSRSEGFPKVMLETASAGVPTLCYGDYGADEWITTGKNGFVVDTYEEACAVVQDLIDNPDKFQPLSKAAVELGRSFDWKVLVKTWEEEIIKMASEK